MEKLLECYGNEKNIYELPEKEIRNNPIWNPKLQNLFLEKRQKNTPEQMLEELKQKKIQVVLRWEKAYPALLKEIPDAPYLLYYKGELPREVMPLVAIIGARACSGYGKSMAEYFAKELSLRGIGIVSGMAQGIDSVAQRTALDNGGFSFGILGCGVDVCYPASNRDLYEKLQRNGGVFSEFPPGTAPKANHFPRRNRIISGLADLLLVIEAREKSGTSITVSMALEQGREVYAVPGRVTDPLSKGCNRLIMEGAGSALNADCILRELEEKYQFSKIQREKVSEEEKKEEKKKKTKRTEEEKQEDEILSILSENARCAEDMIKELPAIEVKKMMAILTRLELEEKIVFERGFYRKREEKIF